MIQRLYNISKSQSFFLFGPRGSGKSTWLKEIFRDDKVLWIDLLNQRQEFELSQDPDRILELWQARKTKWIVVDEVQKIPRILDVVHRGIEDLKINFALTGSSARKLKRGGANLLAGRAVEKKMYPFSTFELGNNFKLDQALALGLLPRIWHEHTLKQADHIDYLYSYVQTYLKEEVAAEQLVRNLDPFRRFLVCAAQSNSKLINYSKIERDAGVSQRQAIRHFEILVDTLLGFYLEPFHTSIRKRQSQRSKFYFFDTGIVRALGNLAGEPLTQSTFEYGDLFETFIMNEFIKLRETLSLRWNYSYFKAQDDLEIDLIVEKPRGKPTLVEIKSGKKIDRDELKKFVRIKSEVSHEKAYLLSQDPTPQEINGIRCLPWKEGLAEIFDL